MAVGPYSMYGDGKSGSAPMPIGIPYADGSYLAGLPGPAELGRSGTLFVFWKPAISQRPPAFVKTKV
jgi:hypothetical protein